MQNIFKFLGRSFGTEDFFTASLALFLDRNDEFREAFLRWIQPGLADDLLSRKWQVKIQVTYPSSHGDAVLDMVLANKDVELWFEHKLGAKMGGIRREAEPVQQLQKYLDAAARAMTGREQDRERVPWPSEGPAPDRPRVLLFYITRELERVDQLLYADNIVDRRGIGLVWPTEGHRRWRDFWPSAKAALDGALGGERGEFERTLATQFLDYWQALPGMSLQDHDQEWAKLLPSTMEKGDSVPFDPYWDLVKERVSSWNWTWSRGWHGIELYLTVPEGTVDQVYVYPLRTVDGPDAKGWNKELGDHVLRVLFRPRSPDHRWPDFSEKALYERWRGRLGLHRVGDRTQVRLLVGITNWKDCDFGVDRKRAVASAFEAGIKMFCKTVDVKLPGVPLS